MFIRPLFCLALCAPWIAIPAAHADIYVYDDADQNAPQEIRLSNLPVDARYQLLIEDSKPVTAAAPTRTDAVVAGASAGTLPFDAAVHAAAAETSLEPALLHAVIAAESRHDTHARSPRGAQGLMQLMPATARRFQVSDPYDPLQNVRAGARYLRELRDLYQGDLMLALAAYNAGPEAVNRFGGHIPPYAETRRYVPKVLRLYKLMTGSQPPIL
jgi:soluble lytic murein transglycosylase-like protein